MPEERRRTLTAEELKVVLKRLDDVMREAEELRRQVTQQLEEQRNRTRQQVTPTSPPSPPKRIRKRR